MMARRFKRKNSAKKIAVKRRRTSIMLSKDKWLTNSKEIKEWAEENKPDNGLCPILTFKPTRWSVDHCHFDLKARGVISQQANTWEGYITKYFIKFCANYTDISLSDALRNLADYLESPYWIENKLHHVGVQDMRKFLERCNKETIARRASEDFNLNLDPGIMLQEDMIVEYLKEFISLYENREGM